MSSSNQFLEKRVQKFTWDQSVDGNLANNTGTVLGILPKGALITGGAIHIVTDLVDADAGDDSTVSFGYTGATAAFWAATAVSTYETGKLLCILPGAGTTTLSEAGPNTRSVAVHAEDIDASWILLAADVQVLLTTGDDVAISAGKVNLYVEYYVSA